MFLPNTEISPGLPCSHNSVAYRKGMNKLHLSLTPDAIAFSHLFLWRASWGQSVAILTGCADALRGRDWDLGRDTQSPLIPSNLCSSFPSPVGYLGQLPLNKGVPHIVGIWFLMLVL